MKSRQLRLRSFQVEQHEPPNADENRNAIHQKHDSFHSARIHRRPRRVDGERDCQKDEQCGAAKEHREARENQNRDSRPISQPNQSDTGEGAEHGDSQEDQH